MSRSRSTRDHATALIGLGTAYLQSGDLAAAQKTFEHAKLIADARAAGAAGLGKGGVGASSTTPRRSNNWKRRSNWRRVRRGCTSRWRPPIAAPVMPPGRGGRRALRHRRRRSAPDDPAADAVADRVLASRVLIRRGQRAARRPLRFAAQAFRAAVAADPQSAEANANFAISLANLGRSQEAQPFLERAIALDEALVIAHLSLGVVYDRQGLDERAIAQYERTLTLDAETQRRDSISPMQGCAPMPCARRSRSTRPRWNAHPMRRRCSVAGDGLRQGRPTGATRAGAGARDGRASAGQGGHQRSRARTASPPPTNGAPRRQPGLALARTLFDTDAQPDVRHQRYAMGLCRQAGIRRATSPWKKRLMRTSGLRVCSNSVLASASQAAARAPLCRGGEQYARESVGVGLPCPAGRAPSLLQHLARVAQSRP